MLPKLPYSSKPAEVGQAWNPSTPEMEAEGSIQGQLQLRSKFEANLSYIQVTLPQTL